MKAQFFSRIFLLRVYQLVSCLLLSNLLRAQQTTSPINVVTTAVPFLRISPDARAGGMGETGIASSPDAASIFYNLAKTPFADRKNAVGITYTPWMRDVADGVYLLTAAGYHQFGKGQAVSASLRYFNIGDLPIMDYNGNHLSTASPREWAFDLGYARKLSEKLSLALTLRYIYSNLASGNMSGTNYKAGSAVASDISLFYHGVDQRGEGWTFGAALSNLGSRISYTDATDKKDFIPASLGIGAGYSVVLNEENKLSLTADIRKLMVPSAPGDSAGIAAYYKKGVVQSWSDSFKDNTYQYSVGGEYAYNHLLFIRAGYFFEDQVQGERKGFTCGFGLTYNLMGFNFSYLAPSGSGTGRNPLSNTVRMGLNLGF
ncbi:type IX secretion system outer membrane channel protein PorV [Flavitalea flava]